MSQHKLQKRPSDLSFTIAQVIEEALQDAGKSKEDVDWLVLHQANQRIIDAAAQRLGMGPHQVVSNLAEYGNTSAASIPLVLDEAVRKGSIQSGSLVRYSALLQASQRQANRSFRADTSHQLRTALLAHLPSSTLSSYLIA